MILLGPYRTTAQTLGDEIMEDLHKQGQQLVLDVDAFMGFTPWKTGAPPTEGWWACRWVSQGKENPEYNSDRKMRRYWHVDGRLHHWSGSVVVGMNDDQAAALKGKASMASPAEIEWSGLTSDPRMNLKTGSRVRERVRLVNEMVKKGRIRLEEAPKA
jgi:hypothetical protein